MASRVDLHIHSTVSDGRFSPAEIVRKAAEAGLAFMALADHDSVDGVAPALAVAGDFPGLKVIPAVEISSDSPHDEVHVLGYFIDYTDGELLDSLQGMRDSRLGRAQGMIARLGEMGVEIEWERVREIAGSGTVGRPHIAQAMLEKGYIASLKEAFDRYISRDGPAYVERKKITPAEAVKVILRVGGLPVLAHPLTISDPEAMIAGLKPAGLVGVEAYYGSYTADEVKRLVAWADKYDLITTGGSDYHGLDEAAETALGGVDVPLAVAERLVAMAGAAAERA